MVIIVRGLVISYNKNIYVVKKSFTCIVSFCNMDEFILSKYQTVEGFIKKSEQDTLFNQVIGEPVLSEFVLADFK